MPPQVQGPSSSSKQEERVVATRVQSRGSDGGVEEGDGGDGNDDDDGMSRVWDVRSEEGKEKEDSRSRQISPAPHPLSVFTMRLLLASRHMRSSIRSTTMTSTRCPSYMTTSLVGSSLRSATISSSRSSSSQSSSSSSRVAIRGIIGRRPAQQGSGRLFLLDSQTATTVRVSRTALGVELCSSALSLLVEGGVRSAEPNMLRGWDTGVDDDGG